VGSFSGWPEPPAGAAAGESARQWAGDTGADVWTAAPNTPPNGFPPVGGEPWPPAERVPADTRQLEEAMYAEARHREAGRADGLGVAGLGNGSTAHDDDTDEPDLDELSLLPRRLRQASLAPQLRETGYAAMPGADSSAGPAAEEIEERSPDQARSTITAIQQGWQRGRSLFDASGKSSDTVAGSGPVGALTEPAPAQPAAAAEDVPAEATAASSDTEPSDTEPSDTEPSDTEPSDTEPSDVDASDADQPGEDDTGPGAE
jgi:hypothetical protein